MTKDAVSTAGSEREAAGTSGAIEGSDDTIEGSDDTIEGSGGTNERTSDAIEMRCACGELLTFERSADHVTCPCGASYAVTITRLTPPDDVSS